MMDFCSRFGELHEHVNPNERHPEYPAITMLANKPVEVNGKKYPGQISDEWHSDQAYTARPPSFAFLNALEIPEVGGDTMFANLYMAYETLSPAFQRTIDSLEAVYDVTVTQFFARTAPERQAQVRERNPPVVHPLVRRHPESGRKTLYLSSQLRNFVGMTAEESAPLRDFLTQHATRYEFVYRHRWTVHDLVMWDNRCAMHRAVTDYDPSRLRRMARCELNAPASGRLYAEPALA